MLTRKEIEAQMALFLAAHSGNTAAYINTYLNVKLSAAGVLALQKYIDDHPTAVQTVGGAFDAFSNLSGGWSGPGRCPLDVPAAADIYNRAS